MLMTRRECCRFLPTLPFLGYTCGLSYPTHNNDDQDSAKKRRAQLLLSKRKNIDLIRYFDEIIFLGDSDLRLQKMLIEPLLKNLGGTSELGICTTRLVDAIAAGGKKIVPIILEAMKQVRGRVEGLRKGTDSKDNFDNIPQYSVLMAALAQFGPDARAAVQVVTNGLKEFHLKDLEEIEYAYKWNFRMVLANIRDEPAPKRLADFFPIPEKLKTQKEIPIPRFPLDRGYFSLKMLLMIKPRRWFGEALIRELAGYYLAELEKLQKENQQNNQSKKQKNPAEKSAFRDNIPPTFVFDDRIILIPIILGSLGERALPAFESLKKCAEILSKRSSNHSLFVSLAMARINPKRRNAVLERLLARSAKIKHSYGGDFASVFQLKEYLYLFMDSDFSRYLGKKLFHRNKGFQGLSMSILGYSGLRSKDAVPDLVKFVQGNANETWRSNAATCLRQIAVESQIDLMEQALKNVRSKYVRDSLEISIKSVKTAGVIDFEK